MKRNMDSDKRDLILKSLLELVNEEGFLGVSMDLLAKKAGISAGSIYYYFESKDAIILHLYQLLRENIDREIFRNERSTDDFKTLFRQLFVSLCTYLTEHPRYFVFMDRFYASPYPQLIHCQEMQFQESNFSAFFNRGIREKIIKPYNMHLITSLFMGAVTVGIKKHILGVYPLKKKDMEVMATVLWEGLKA